MVIGDYIKGGIIFYTGTTSGSTVLIAALEDLGSLYWGCIGNPIGGTSTDIYLGDSNTLSILSGCTGNTMIAATACYDFVSGVYSDWYLPSKDELNEMFLHKDLIPKLSYVDNYWSSSQFNQDCAWIQYFLNGTQSGLGGKDQLYRVRPIRKF